MRGGWLSSGGAYRDLTPHTVEPSQALVTLNGFVTLVTLGGAVPFYPEMMHNLQSEGDRKQRGKQVRKETCRRKTRHIQLHNREEKTRQESNQMSLCEPCL